MSICDYFMVEENGCLSDAVGVDWNEEDALTETAEDMEMRDGDVVHVYEVNKVGTYRVVAKIELKEIR